MDLDQDQLRQLLSQSQAPDPTQIGTNLVASNAPTGAPMAPFDQMPAPLNRDLPDDDDGGAPASGPAPVKPQGPAAQGPMFGPPKPADDADDSSDDSAPADDKAKNPLADLMLTSKDYDDARARKRADIKMGMIADALTNFQAPGNFYLHTLNPQSNMQQYFKQLADMENQPIEKKQALLKQALQGPNDQLLMNSADAGSDYSKLMGKVMAGNIQANTQLAPEVKTDMLNRIQGKSALELNQLANSGPFKDLMANDKLFQTLKSKAEIAEEGFNKAMALTQHADQRAEGRNNAFQGRTDVQAWGKVADDPQLTGMTNQSRNIHKALEQMNDPKNPPSWTQMAEVAQDISAALSNAKASTDFKLKSIEGEASLDKMRGMIAAQISSNPNQPANPETVQFWLGMSKRLNGIYDQQIKARADYIQRTAPASVKKVMQDATQPFIDGSWKGEANGAQAPASKMNPDDQAALQHVKDNPNDPDSKKILAILKQKYPGQVQ